MIRLNILSILALPSVIMAGCVDLTGSLEEVSPVECNENESLDLEPCSGIYSWVSAGST